MLLTNYNYINRNALSFISYRYYDTVAIPSSSTSTRKSSHYHNQNGSRKSPNSPSMKSVSYIYDQNGKKHSSISKQDSNLSRQMLLKQDSSISRQSFAKQDSFASHSGKFNENLVIFGSGQDIDELVWLFVL